MDPIDTTPGKLDALDRRMSESNDRFDDQLQLVHERINSFEAGLNENTALSRRASAAQIATAARVERLEEAVAENTRKTDDTFEVVKDIRDFQGGARVTRKAVVWIGGLAAGGVGIWQAWVEVVKHWGGR